MARPCQNCAMPSAIRSTLRTGASLVALGAATTAYSLWEARQYTLREVEIPLPRRLPPPARDRADLRILHLSDLHMSPRDTDRIAWVRALGELDVDMTVVTGDFHGDPRGPVLALEALAPLLDRPGLFVRGSNDYYAPARANPAKYLLGPSTLRTKRPAIDVTPLNTGLTAAGWNDLTTLRPNVAGWRIDARGVDDPHIRRDRYGAVAGAFRPGGRPAARRHPCALPAGARRDGGRWLRPDPGGAHPRWARCACPSSARWSPTATSPGTGPRGSPGGTGPPCTSRPDSGRAPTRPSDWRAGPRRRL